MACAFLPQNVMHSEDDRGSGPLHAVGAGLVGVSDVGAGLVGVLDAVAGLVGALDLGPPRRHRLPSWLSSPFTTSLQ